MFTGRPRKEEKPDIDGLSASRGTHVVCKSLTDTACASATSTGFCDVTHSQELGENVLLVVVVAHGKRKLNEYYGRPRTS